MALPKHNHNTAVAQELTCIEVVITKTLLRELN